MKPAICKMMVLLAMLTIAVCTLSAQQTGSRFTVPFSFVVNGQTLPAGNYSIEGLWWNAVAFHNLKGGPGLVVLAQYGPRTQGGKTKLVFHRYPDRYVLAAAELPNTDYGRAFQTDLVTHLIKMGPQVSQVKPQVVEIAGK